MRKIKLALLILMCFAVVISSGITAFAADGANASSPGIPGQKPLSFVSITLEDGSKTDIPGGITTEPKFKLTFDKNVVNMLVWGNNSKCFTLINGSNGNVPISVTKVDDTIDFSQRQVIFVQPVNKLSPGTTYYLKISPNLLAKNGNSTLGATTSGKGVTITFKTKGQAPQSTPASTSSPVQKSAGDSANTGSSTTGAKSSTAVNSSTPIPNNAGESTEATVDPNTSEVQERVDIITKSAPAAGENNQEAANGQGNQIVKMISDNWLAGSVVLLIILWVGAEMVIRKKKGIKNNNQ